jgi:hypothetical protein
MQQAGGSGCILAHACFGLRFLHYKTLFSLLCIVAFLTTAKKGTYNVWKEEMANTRSLGRRTQAGAI